LSGARRVAGIAAATPDITVDGLDVSAFTVPTDEPESDGTMEWDSTTIVVVETRGGGQRGLGYTYGDIAVAALIRSTLADLVDGVDALAPPAAWASMHAALRNVGQQGVGAMALSAVDVALWDLKARLLGVSLADLLPRFRRRVPVYGSGGFTSYSDERLAAQLADWVNGGIPRVKIKIGREPDRDPERLTAARAAIGPGVELMADANGAYDVPRAIEWATRLRERWDVTYLEEPVTSDDVTGLARVRDHAPPGLAIAAGEYAWDVYGCRRLLDEGAVDILQADVTRCGGITALLCIDGLCRAHGTPFSAHCAPAISAHACAAMAAAIHIEYFHDHSRIERMLFEGVPDVRNGSLEPDRERPGLGLELRRPDALEFAVS
jgi:L-alanine-DL-glutamate epimerase-like enolase superfamily enzyme